MSATPLSRIYFDTNALFGWPSIPRTGNWLAMLAQWLSVKMYVPAAVEVELEEQFMRPGFGFAQSDRTNRSTRYKALGQHRAERCGGSQN